MDERKAELERKRKKLEELKKAREKRKEGHDESGVTSEGGTGTTTPAVSVTAGADGREDVDQLVNALIGDKASNQTSSTASPAAVAAASVVAEQHAASTADAHAQGHSRPARHVQLTFSPILQTEIAARPVVSYTKETQTLDLSQQQEADSEDEVVVLKASSQQAKSTEETDASAAADMQSAAETAQTQPVKELTEEEIRAIEASEGFRTFFERSSIYVERALNSFYDVTVDYRIGEEENKDDGDGMNLSYVRRFHDDRWSKSRSVTSLDWSSRYPELFLASYNRNLSAPHEPDGCVMVWNLHLPERPEFVFTSQSPVLSACFAKFHPNLIVGGTYSGQLLLWDNRAKQTPVQRTPLTGKSHTHPVYALSIVGTQNAHSLVSVSTDGQVCSWTLDMFSQPQQSIELRAASARNELISATCLSFPKNDIDNFVVGSEDGTVYTSCRHSSKAGSGEAFTGHAGPITSVDFNKSHNDLSDLFLSSSLDWTVKLWSSKNPQPLYSFEGAGDYVFDARWSPTHPAVFASVDGNGHVDVWNINRDVELPTVTAEVEGHPALNTVHWSDDGTHLICGSADGDVLLYDVGERLRTPRADEASRLKRTLKELTMANVPTSAPNTTAVSVGDAAAE